MFLVIEPNNRLNLEHFQKFDKPIGLSIRNEYDFKRLSPHENERLLEGIKLCNNVVGLIAVTSIMPYSIVKFYHERFVILDITFKYLSNFCALFENINNYSNLKYLSIQFLFVSEDVCSEEGVKNRLLYFVSKMKRLKFLHISTFMSGSFCSSFCDSILQRNALIAKNLSNYVSQLFDYFKNRLQKDIAQLICRSIWKERYQMIWI